MDYDTLSFGEGRGEATGWQLLNRVHQTIFKKPTQI